jgi:hypothetical protein
MNMFNPVQYVTVVGVVHLFTVADRFQIEERGCVLIPGLPTEAGSPKVQQGARILLRTPDGLEIQTLVEAIEFIRYAKQPEKICDPILLPKDLTKDQVPVGTEVFLIG